ncbi:MAG: hypothetical protein ACKPBG_12255 [Actinomycetota bacterium]
MIPVIVMVNVSVALGAENSSYAVTDTEVVPNALAAGVKVSVPVGLTAGWTVNKLVVEATTMKVTSPDSPSPGE